MLEWTCPSLHGYLALLMSTAASFLLVLAIITQEGLGWMETWSLEISEWGASDYANALLFSRQFSPLYFRSKNV